MAVSIQTLNESASRLIHSEDPSIRYLALRQLSDAADDDPNLQIVRQQAHQSGPISRILDHMHPDGYWEVPGAGYNPKYRSGVWSLILLAQLGAQVSEDQRLQRACSYMLDHALAAGGQFSVNGAPSGTIPCLQGNLLWSIMEMGYQDPRLQGAIEWMARSVTGDGIAPVEDKNAPVRYYAYHCGPDFACGPNLKAPCAWGGVKILLALGKIPTSQRTPLIRQAIHRGIEFCLGIDPAAAEYPHGEAPRPSPNWWKFGFPVFYITDLLQLVDALARLGAGSDPRLSHAIQLILDKADPNGQWALEYDYQGKTWGSYGSKKSPNPYVTLRALSALRACGILLAPISA